MSFFLTTQQVRDGTKTVTRRLGWRFLKPGDVIMACVKCQGLRKGEKIERIRPLRVVSTLWVTLQTITPEDVVREGFPGWTPAEFTAMFCAHNGCDENTPVNRIEFEYVDEL